MRPVDNFVFYVVYGWLLLLSLYLSMRIYCSQYANCNWPFSWTVNRLAAAAAAARCIIWSLGSCKNVIHNNGQENAVILWLRTNGFCVIYWAILWTAAKKKSFDLLLPEEGERGKFTLSSSCSSSSSLSSCHQNINILFRKFNFFILLQIKFIIRGFSFISSTSSSS